MPLQFIPTHQPQGGQCEGNTSALGRGGPSYPKEDTMERYYLLKDTLATSISMPGTDDWLRLRSGEHSLFICHGKEDGHLASEAASKEITSCDLVICCFPAQVQAAHPEWHVLFSECRGPVAGKVWTALNPKDSVFEVWPA